MPFKNGMTISKWHPSDAPKSTYTFLKGTSQNGRVALKSVKRTAFKYLVLLLPDWRLKSLRRLPLINAPEL